jgi:hypothetical protein
VIGGVGAYGRMIVPSPVGKLGRLGRAGKTGRS